VELLGRNSKRNNVTRLRTILAGHERDRPPARATRSPQRQRRLDDQEQVQLLAAYDQGVMINDRAEMFGLSRTAVIANLTDSGPNPAEGSSNGVSKKPSRSTNRDGHSPRSARSTASTPRRCATHSSEPVSPCGHALVRGDDGAVDVDGEAPAIRSTSAPLRAGGGAVAA
jgi:hypothetical protein